MIKCGKTHVSKAALRAHQRAAHKDTDEMMSVMLPTVEVGVFDRTIYLPVIGQ